MTKPQPDPERIKALLGGQFGRPRVTDMTVIDEQPYHGVTVEEIKLTISDKYKIPATRIRQNDPNQPTILYCHAHGNAYEIGRKELIEGRPALAAPYGPGLAALGFNVLCLDMPAFGDRAHLKEDALAKTYHWYGSTLFGEMIAELNAAVEWLAADPKTDANRIAALGISMGATHAWWLAALSPHVAAAAHLCAFADLATLIEKKSHNLHGPYMTVPGLLATTTTGAIAGLAAPKPQLICAGLKDPLTPADALLVARQDLETAYKDPAPLRWVIEAKSGHEETPAMREAVLQFLSDQLLTPSGA